MEFRMLIKEGLHLVSTVEQELKLIRAQHYKSAELDIIDTAAIYLTSAQDLLVYAEELYPQSLRVANDKLLIACQAVDKVQRILVREFSVESEANKWVNSVNLAKKRERYLM